MAQRDDSEATARASSGSSRLDPLEQALLLRAAEQLQDAIKSTRKYRTTSSTRTSSPRPSALVQSNHSVCKPALANESGRVVGDNDPYSSTGETDDDKENARSNGLRITHRGAMSTDRSASLSNASAKVLALPERLAPRQTTQSLSGDLGFELSHLSDDSCVSDASPSIHDRSSSNSRIQPASRYTVSEWERRGILRMSELSLSRLSQSDFDPLESHRTDRRDADASIHAMTQRALVWMQQDTEKQAKAARAMHELLRGVVLILNDVFSDLLALESVSDCGSGAATAPWTYMKDAPHWPELSIERVDALVSEWECALLTWRRAADARVREAAERAALFREDCRAKNRVLLDTHARERMVLQTKIADLTARVEQQQMLSEDTAGRRAMDHDTRPEPPSCSGASQSLQCQTHEQIGALERANLDLKAQLKGAELCYLHWQAAYADQAAQTHHVVEQLGMALEDTAGCQMRVHEVQRQLAKTISIDALRLYQQKIAALEAHVRDMQAQIACDHEEFAYEQHKWRLERKHLGQDVQEIQDVSVKVLKVVLIREKLLKQQEQRLAARTQAVDAQQQHVQEQSVAAQSVVRELMRETALVLVALQDWRTKMPVDDAPPVRPVVLKKMLKRLRRIDAAIASARVREADSEGARGDPDTETLHAHRAMGSGEDRE